LEFFKGRFKNRFQEFLKFFQSSHAYDIVRRHKINLQNIEYSQNPNNSGQLLVKFAAPMTNKSALIDISDASSSIFKEFNSYFLGSRQVQRSIRHGGYYIYPLEPLTKDINQLLQCFASLIQKLQKNQQI